MNLYLENAGVYLNIRRVLRCMRLFSGRSFSVHVLAHDGCAVLTLLALIFFKRVKKAVLHAETTRLSSPALLIIRSSAKVSLHLKVENEIPSEDMKKISSIHKCVVFEDNTDLNTDNYRKYRYSAVDSDFFSEPQLYDMLRILSGREPEMCCESSSCLGKNLYIEKNGEMHFCPKHPEKSSVGSIDDGSDPFDHPDFSDVLKAEIEKRERCKSVCAYFYECKGACALDDRCRSFKDVREKTKEFISLYSSPDKDLSDLKYLYEKGLIEFFSKDMMPDMKKAGADSGGSGNVKV